MVLGCAAERRSARWQKHIMDISTGASRFLDKLFMLIMQGEQLSLYKSRYAFKSTLQSRCNHLIYFRNTEYASSREGCGGKLLAASRVWTSLCSVICWTNGSDVSGGGYKMKMLSPVVGAWYKDLQTQGLFEVIDWDPESLTIETQHLDGEVSEYDLDAWREMRLEEVEAPEDWRAAFELDDDDLLDPDLPLHPENWASPINSIEPDAMYGVEDY
jgi:hypothetical protein